MTDRGLWPVEARSVGVVLNIDRTETEVAACVCVIPPSHPRTALSAPLQCWLADQCQGPHAHLLSPQGPRSCSTGKQAKPNCPTASHKIVLYDGGRRGEGGPVLPSS